MATVLYNYFCENFGYVDENNDVDLKRKYEKFSAKDLKKALKKLKHINHDSLITKNFWGYVKRIF